MLKKVYLQCAKNLVLFTVCKNEEQVRLRCAMTIGEGRKGASPHGDLRKRDKQSKLSFRCRKQVESHVSEQVTPGKGEMI